MPLLPNPAENFYTQEAENVAPVLPTSPEELIENHLDTASVFMDIQGGAEFVLSLNGSPETVTYYSAIMRSDDLVINSHDIVDRTLKQYRRINNYEIRVTSAPTMTVDDSTNTSTVVGEANVYPIITPKVGDVFVKPITTEDHQYGVFQVIDVRRKSMYSGTSWGITFSQIRYTEEHIDVKSEPFVITEFDFIVSNLELGKNPLLPTDTNLLLQNCTVVRRELISIYYNAFYDIKTGTFLKPTMNGTRVYDPFVVKFWNSIIDTDMYPECTRSPAEYPVNNSFLEKFFTTIFDTYMNQSIGTLPSVIRYMFHIDTHMFTAPYLKLTSFTSALTYVVHPQAMTDLQNKPLFTSTPMTSANSYIFTEGFYSGVGETLLEQLILKVIRKQAVLLKDVFVAYELVKDATRVEQFYHLPFIISLLQVAR